MARHVDVIEEDVECKGLDDRDLENENLNKSFEQNENINDKENENLKNSNKNLENEIENVPGLRRPQRNIKRPSRFSDNFVYNGCIYVNYCSADSPENFDKAIRCDKSSFCKMQ